MTDDALENVAWPKMRMNSAENDLVFKTKFSFQVKSQSSGAVVVAQLVERSLPTPEVHGLNTVIVNFIYLQMY